MPSCAIPVDAARMAALIARRVSPVVAMQAHFVRTAQVEAHKQFQQFNGGVALGEFRGSLRAIAEDSSFSSELVRCQGDGDG
ncbi:hypothetical protein ABIF62_005268 [Bradyrhizobium japonicum]